MGSGRSDQAGRCRRCGARRCLCASIPSIATETRFVILRHAWELDKGSNSARIAHLALPNSVIHDIGKVGQPFDPAWIPDGAWLLFPDGPQTDAPPPRTVVVLDGTWAQARKMLKRNAALWTLPRLAIPSLPPRLRIRTSPTPDAMSTLEAIAQAVGLLESEASGAALLELYDVFWRHVSPRAHPSVDGFDL